MPIVLILPDNEFSSELVTIGYDNIAERSVVSASSTAVGFDPSFVSQWVLHNAWQAVGVSEEFVMFDALTPQYADYFAIFGHNIASIGAIVHFETADNAGGPWITRISVAPTRDDVIFKRFAKIQLRYYRIRVTGGAAAPLIALISFGVAFETQRGMQPGYTPPIVDKYRIENGESEDSIFIGRSVKKEAHKITFELELLTPDWVRQYWSPFLDHASFKPFFVSWNDDGYPDEAVYAWTNAWSLPDYQDVVNMRARLSFNALRNID